MEAAAAFRFEDSGLVAAWEPAAAKSEPEAVVRVVARAEAAAVGPELRPDRSRARHHRRILPHLRRCRGPHR